MKKCPYCKTLVQDEVEICPHCCHNLADVRPMPDPVNRKFSTEIYLMLFGAIIALGGVVAGFNQYDKMKRFNELSHLSEETETIAHYRSLASQAGMEMTMMIVLSAVGVAMLIGGFVQLIGRKVRTERKKADR